MSEEKKEKVKKEASAEDITPAEQLARQKKARIPWTVQKCKRAARRFSSEHAWAQGAPASYKSASAHGWVRDCLAVQKSDGSKANRAGIKPRGKQRTA